MRVLLFVHWLLLNILKSLILFAARDPRNKNLKTNFVGSDKNKLRNFPVDLDTHNSMGATRTAEIASNEGSQKSETKKREVTCWGRKDITPKVFY